MASNIVYWTTHEGKKIDVDKMSIEHLRNALKTVLRARIQAAKFRKPDNKHRFDEFAFDPYWDLD